MLAMLKELNSFLHKSSSEDNSGQFILVSDSLTDGGFLIHHHISQALQDGHMTYLISFAQSFIHYHSIAMKLGTNLSKEEESGRFVFVDCLTHLMDDSDTSRHSTDSKAASSNSRLTFSLSSELSLRGLYQQVFHSVERALLQVDRPVCVIIDDLSVLLSLGVELSEVVSFISYCRRMLLSPNGLCTGRGYLVAMVHCDVCDSDEEEQLLRRHLLHVCHLSLHVEGLATGYSKDVHGNLTVEWRDPGGGGGGGSGQGAKPTHTSQQVQYKLTDRSIKLFAKGTSKAVL